MSLHYIVHTHNYYHFTTAKNTQYYNTRTVEIRYIVSLPFLYEYLVDSEKPYLWCKYTRTLHLLGAELLCADSHVLPLFW